MSIADQIPIEKSGLDSERLFNVMWLGPVGFVAGCVALIIMQRLGLPMSVTLALATLWFALAVIILSVMGRSMTGRAFFFANHLATGGVIGSGGVFDWISGSFLMLYFSSSLLGQMIVVPALMLGLLLQACLFAMAMKRSGAATVPGFFSWRVESQLAGPIVMLVVGVVLGLICVAEYSVLRSVFLTVSRLGEPTAVWTILILAVLPTIMGGWLSLILVNGVLASCLMVATLFPAIVVGFMPSFLKQGAESVQADATLPPLQASGVELLSVSNEANAIGVLLAVAVLSTGFAVLPHALSRITLNSRSLIAIEGTGWSALSCFLVIGALPLSLGLVAVAPTSSTLSVLLRSQDTLFMLPYFALLFAAFNTFAVTLFILSSSMVRAMRRSRNLNPSEQSLFMVRFLTVLFAIAIAQIPAGYLMSPATLLVWALCIGSAGLFAPMVASIWATGVPKMAFVLAVPLGAGSAIFSFLSPVETFKLSAIDAGAAGLLISTAVIVLARIYTIVRSKRVRDPQVAMLHSPNNTL